MRFSDWEKIDEARGKCSRGVFIATILHRTWNAQQNRGCLPEA
jgi:hypothetical protein